MAAKPKTSRTENFEFGPWKITGVKGHILESEGQHRESFEKELKLPQVPEMIFADNILRLEYVGQICVEFTALEALKLVDPEHDLMKVAVANAWREARADCEFINDVVKPFDWTFSTDYCGTVSGLAGCKVEIEETTERIDLEKLKVREKIHFYDDILLFEDELADNGCSILSVKIRVMPSSFFILMRFYLRVDGIMIRQNDTRLYHQAGTDYILREFSSKEKKVQDLHVMNDAGIPNCIPTSFNQAFSTVKNLLPTHEEVHVSPHVLIDVNEISPHLDLKRETIHKIMLPTKSRETQTNQVDSSTNVNQTNSPSVT